MKIKLFATGFIVSIIAGLFVVQVQAHQNQCNANNVDNCPVPTQICDQGLAVGNPHCLPSVTPTVTPSCTPEVSVILKPTEGVTPSATPEATVTPSPDNHGDNHSDGLSDGQHTAPDGLGCAVHECGVVPQKAPATGRG